MLCAFEVPATALGIDGLPVVVPVVVVPEAGAWHHDNKNEKNYTFGYCILMGAFDKGGSALCIFDHDPQNRIYS